MSVLDGYKPKTMGELESLAIVIIGQQFRNRGVRCALIGERLFADEPVALKGSAPFARLAGKVMRRLEDRGVAMIDGKTGGWKLTQSGLRELEEA